MTDCATASVAMSTATASIQNFTMTGRAAIISARGRPNCPLSTAWPISAAASVRQPAGPRLAYHASRDDARSEDDAQRGGRMKLIKAIVRPNKVEEIKDAVGKLGVSGITVTEVRGHGKQKGHTAIYRGQEYTISLVPKIEIEIVV